KEEFSSIGKMDHPSISNESFVEIETLSATLDSLVSKHKLIPGFIKVDVEGAEHLVFQGAQSVLREHRPIIFSEVSDYLLKRNGSSAKEVMESISQNNYKIIDPFNPHVRPENQDFTDILCLPE
ncbi:FkbM family methyltransferase, partial [bacterium]|nr:FkbM family methyltransferase [bacterium]